MPTLKKAIAVALFAIGAGAAASAMAGSSYEECLAYQQQCNEGDVRSCMDFDQYRCWRWDL